MSISKTGVTVAVNAIGASELVHSKTESFPLSQVLTTRSYTVNLPRGNYLVNAQQDYGSGSIKTSVVNETLFPTAGSDTTRIVSDEIPKIDIEYAGPVWTTRTSGFGGTGVEGIAYGNGLYVAVGAGPYIQTSTNAITWTTRTNPFGTSIPHTVTYGNGLFVIGSGAASSNNAAAISTDGITWTSQAIGSGGLTLFASGYGNGVYLVGGNVGAYTSNDGVTWTARTTAFGGSSFMYAITYGEGLYVIGGSSNGTAPVIQTSTDGITWTTRASGMASGGSVAGLAYGNGTFVAVGNSVSTSTDGITWTTGAAYAGNAVTYGKGLFVMTGPSGVVRSSTDGVTWTTQTSNFGTTSVLSIAYGNRTFVAGAAGAAGIRTASAGAQSTVQIYKI